MPPRVKICCIQDAEEAALAVAAGAHALGFVGRGLSGPEVIEDDARIAAIVATVPPGVDAWLLARDAEPGVLVERVRKTRVNTVQICDAVPRGVYEELRVGAPWCRIVQVVHVSGPEAVEEALGVEDAVDAILLDSGTPSGATPVFGGSGKTHDWGISARVVDAVRKPVWLAGGLRAENVAEAFSVVRPWGLDLCSGVRANGRLNAARLQAYAATVAAVG